MKPSLRYSSSIQKLRPSLIALKEVVAKVELAPRITAFYILTCENSEAEIETYNLALQMGAHRYPVWVGGHSLAIALKDEHQNFVKRWLSRTDTSEINRSDVVVLDAAKLFLNELKG